MPFGLHIRIMNLFGCCDVRSCPCIPHLKYSCSAIAMLMHTENAMANIHMRSTNFFTHLPLTSFQLSHRSPPKKPFPSCRRWSFTDGTYGHDHFYSAIRFSIYPYRRLHWPHSLADQTQWRAYYIRFVCATRRGQCLREKPILHICIFRRTIIIMPWIKGMGGMFLAAAVAPLATENNTDIRAAE